MKELVLGIWLGVQASIDFKYKEIPGWFCLLAAIIGMVFCILEKRGIESIFLSLMPGVLFLCFSKLTKEVIGYGDGMVLVAMAFFLSLEQQVTILMTAFIVAGVVALVLLIFFHKKGNYRIPLIPFIFVAFLIECATCVEEIGI